MTNTQAHQFVARWRRILIPWFAKTEAEALRDIERSCIGMAGGSFLMLSISANNMTNSSSSRLLLILPAAMFFYSIPMIFRCRKARRVLSQS
jgi:hypothetical protein